MNRTNPPAPIRLKLLIDTRGKRVVFAEADKDFVDFLFRILSLPLAHAVGLLGNDAAALGSFVNLHGSLKTYFTSSSTLLKPANLRRAAGSGVVVKGLVSYMVTDELRVTPLTTASTMNEMNKLNVERPADLQESLVQFTTDEAGKFLKTALQSKNVLTDFFLKTTLLNDTCQNGECPPPRTVKREVPIWVDRTMTEVPLMILGGLFILLENHFSFILSQLTLE